MAHGATLGLAPINNSHPGTNLGPGLDIGSNGDSVITLNRALQQQKPHNVTPQAQPQSIMNGCLTPRMLARSLIVT